MLIKKPSSTLSLSSWVTIGLVLALLITTSSMLILVDQFTRSYARSQAQARLSQLAWQMQEALDRSLGERFIDVKIMATRPALREANDVFRIRGIFNELQKNVPNYAWIGLAMPDGKVLAAVNGLLEKQSVAERPWFKEGRKDFYVGDYHPALMLASKLPISNEPWRFVDISTPIMGTDGKFKGVLGVHLSWEWARDLVKKLVNPTNDRFDVDIMLVRDDGTVVLGPKDMEEKKMDSDSFRASLRLPSGALREVGPDGTPYLTGFARTGLNSEYGDLKWSVLVRQPEQLAMRGFRDLQRQMLLVACAVSIVLMVLVFALARRLVAPMNQLNAALERRAMGDHDVEVPIINTYHEVALLSTTLATLVQREESYLKEMRQLNEGLEQRVEDRTRRLHETAIALQQALDTQRENQAKLEESENELRAILHNANDAFIAMDQNGVVQEWNRQAEILLGWSREEALGRELAEMIVPPEQRDLHRAGMKQYLATGEGLLMNTRVEMQAIRRDGDELPVEMTLGYVEVRSGCLFIAFLHDITERLAFRNSLQEMALSDILTGLPNRRAFAQKLPEAMARAERDPLKMGLLFMDIDGFKQINDKYGHIAGDELLMLFASRLRESVRDVDTVARLAGDEFTVILERLHSRDDALGVARKILAAMRAPFYLREATINISVSIGAAMFDPAVHTTQDRLVAQADNAMYVAKNAGKNRVEVSA
ncbi:diguanylate cyclase (GGDEF)-like protein/PAS domain S-box-containing protein [Herbaspirillum sp. Sphag1AN]|uniref:diguanylate cyclase domain-containing protein n=1 Tax=unclassified Herbaspirillum TaxID=2624150 RepID=UPI0017F7DD1A|nr:MULTISPECIES: diguanylate cyclase [unclassified Herbaspirillum]MBB3211410.1 diguanylate cyclase (GGDEF)-like protein/PAS domain S-box-containing protein [Herbaspirillum sp. Sphag1AN]MBB3245323.1 diguanylate cyclase (GGDEF)-like protein/PAS domain S-box-containing protein [Herbaspirillum sp. Sphag64]